MVQAPKKRNYRIISKVDFPPLTNHVSEILRILGIGFDFEIALQIIYLLLQIITDGASSLPPHMITLVDQCGCRI